MQKMIKILGGKEETALSFAGIGDLLLTCTSEKSRNYTFGKLLGESKIPNQVKEYLDTHTVEGYYTLESVYQILKEKKEQVPIIELIYNIAVKQKNPNELFTYLVEK